MRAYRTSNSIFAQAPVMLKYFIMDKRSNHRVCTSHGLTYLLNDLLAFALPPSYVAPLATLLKQEIKNKTIEINAASANIEDAAPPAPLEVDASLQWSSVMSIPHLSDKAQVDEQVVQAIERIHQCASDVSAHYHAVLLTIPCHGEQALFTLGIYDYVGEGTTATLYHLQTRDVFALVLDEQDPLHLLFALKLASIFDMTYAIGFDWRIFRSHHFPISPTALASLSPEVWSALHHILTSQYMLLRRYRVNGQPPQTDAAIIGDDVAAELKQSTDPESASKPTGLSRLNIRQLYDRGDPRELRQWACATLRGMLIQQYFYADIMPNLVEAAMHMICDAPNLHTLTAPVVEAAFRCMAATRGSIWRSEAIHAQHMPMQHKDAHERCADTLLRHACYWLSSHAQVAQQRWIDECLRDMERWGAMHMPAAQFQTSSASTRPGDLPMKSLDLSPGAGIGADRVVGVGAQVDTPSASGAGRDILDWREEVNTLLVLSHTIVLGNCVAFYLASPYRPRFYQEKFVATYLHIARNSADARLPAQEDAFNYCRDIWRIAHTTFFEDVTHLDLSSVTAQMHHLKTSGLIYWLLWRLHFIRPSIFGLNYLSLVREIVHPLTVPVNHESVALWMIRTCTPRESIAMVIVCFALLWSSVHQPHKAHPPHLMGWLRAMCDDPAAELQAWQKLLFDELTPRGRSLLAACFPSLHDTLRIFCADPRDESQRAQLQFDGADIRRIIVDFFPPAGQSMTSWESNMVLYAHALLRRLLEISDFLKEDSYSPLWQEALYSYFQELSHNRADGYLVSIAATLHLYHLYCLLCDDDDERVMLWALRACDELTTHLWHDADIGLCDQGIARLFYETILEALVHLSEVFRQREKSSEHVGLFVFLFQQLCFALSSGHITVNDDQMESLITYYPYLPEHARQWLLSCLYYE